MDRTARLTLVATGLGLFMIFLDALIVNVGLPSIQASFKVGEAGLQWVVAAYSLGMAVFIMTAATLADLHGRRLWYVIGIAVFTLASIACGLAPSLEILNFARGVQGIAAATANVTSLALVSAAFPDPKDKARAIGIWTAIASVGTAVGPTLGGFLVEHWGWRSIFLVNVPVGLVVVFLTLRFVKESRDERPRTLDVVGQVLFMVTVGALAYAVIEGPKAGWTSAGIVSAVRDRGGRMRAVHLVRAPARGPDDGPLAVPRPGVRARHRDHLRGVLLDLRHAAAHHAVPAERARVHAGADGPHHPAVQLRGDGRVAAHGPPGRTVRRATPDPPRLGVADRGPRRPDARGPREARRWCCSVSGSPGSAARCASRRSRRSR